jgi:dihydrofolate synthase/folylpolyglutamate synthase
VDYREAKDYIKASAKFGSKLGLDTITALCARLGNPQDQLAFVHVAGTNGKGSTCVMISSILQKAGHKPGLFLSPHLAEHRDSLFAGGEMMTEAAFAETMTIVKNAADALAHEDMIATEFELLTACAFQWFAERGCKIAVLETGLGGRLDATNCVKNTQVSVITAIAMDHMQYLGDTLEKIAREKCGIIKPGGVTVCYPDQPREALAVIQASAAEKGNDIIIPDRSRMEVTDLGLEGIVIGYQNIHAHLRLLGLHQAGNAATAIEAARALREWYGVSIPDEAITKGLEAACLPARQEILCRKPLVLLDGAHNLQGIEALEETVKIHIAGRRTAVVMGMLRDKQYHECIGIMARLCDKLFAVKPDNARALEADEVAEVARVHGCDASAFDDADKALREALEFCGPDGAVVICGSLYMADKMRSAAIRLLKHTAGSKQNFFL